MVTALLRSEPVDELWHRLMLEQQAALINPQQVDAALWKDLPTQLLVPPELKAYEKLMPRLLDLESMKADARVQLLDRVEQHEAQSDQPFFSALMTFQHETTTGNRAQRLANRLILTGPESRSALLRFYDPRVFQHLLWIFNDNQLSRLLNGVKQYLWRDTNNQWRTFKPPQVTTASRLHVSQHQWDNINQISVLNRCLTLLSAGRHINVAATKVVQRVHTLLLKAQEHGLTDADDACLFVEQAMVFGDALHRHPAMQERLKQVRMGKSSYQAACQSLNDEQLTHFVDELHYASSHPQQGKLA